MALFVTAPFKRGGAFPVDEDLVKTKAQMRSVDDNVMPNKYLTVCDDDGQLYLYDKSNTVDSETGKYRLFKSGDEVVELTKAEYDALSVEEKMNGKVYFITDWGGRKAGSGGILKIAEAGVVEFEAPIEVGEIKYKTLYFGYNLLPSDSWSVSATLGAPTSGVDRRWQEQKDGVRLLPVTATAQGSLRIEVIFEKGFSTNYGGKVPVYYQFYANVKRPHIGQSEHFGGGNQIGDLYTTSRAIYDGYMDYEILLATAIGDAITRGGHLNVAFTDSEYMFETRIAVLDKTRSIVKNQNDGATYYPIVWDKPNVTTDNITYLAIHPTNEDKYKIFFTNATTDNAYQYVDSVDSLIGLMGVYVYDMEVL